MEKDIKIYAKTIEQEAIDQCNAIMETPAFKDAKVRIMPDVHAGKGCVVGFTAKDFKGVIPSVIGCDIGCGMLVAKLKNRITDFEKFDEIINTVVPAGMNVFDKYENTLGVDPRLYALSCYHEIHDIERIKCSLGTLGGGNHFLEVDEDKDGNQYVVIHSGSRNLGKQVEQIYTERARSYVVDKFNEDKNQLIKILKSNGLEKNIGPLLKELNKHKPPKSNSALIALSEEDTTMYLKDMKITQEFAASNRKTILQNVLNAAGLKASEVHEVIHNYIDFSNEERPVIRKGAISAKKGEFVLIPLNMRDGCIIGKGKGNHHWNESAPHGAGRIMSRAKANEMVDMDDFKNSMEGIYTSSVTEDTKDEAPSVYKPAQEIIDTISKTVDIQDVIKPVYNFKAH